MDLEDLLSPVHLAALLVIALLVFGPGRLPELGGAVGKTIQSFRAAMRDNSAPQPPTRTTPPQVQQHDDTGSTP